MSLDIGALPTKGAHCVKFYAQDAELVAVVLDYVSAALTRGDVAVVVASEPHRDALCDGLMAAGVETATLVADEQLVLVDAAETLAQIRVGGRRINHAAYEDVVGGWLRRLLSRGRDVVLYGEMVGLLWDAGDVSGAMELEQLWDEFLERVSVTSLCGYRLPAGAQAAFVDDVCLLHSQVLTNAPTRDGAQVARWFPQAEWGPAVARRFVTETVRAWGRAHLVEECQLVVSELATNAVRHSGGDFTVSLSPVPRGVELAVGDPSTTPPTLQDPGVLSADGRGLQVVDVNSSRWGYQVVGGGKLVWAQILASDEGRAE